MAFFFATAEDLLPVLLSVEANHAIVYTPMGQVCESAPAHYRTARDLPTLFRPQPHESAGNGPRYLVTELGTEVLCDESPGIRNKRMLVDQLANRDSTVLQHGGLYKESILLEGEVRTAYRTTVAQRLQRAFDSAIRKHFVKIQAYYVGPAAEMMLDSGCRLTSAEQCPRDLDLRR
jgi:hypothetical protein